MTPEQFMECFGAVAEAEGGIAKLRNLLIDSASIGRLGTQRDSDEPALNLLKRVAKRHVEAVNAKQTKPLADWHPPSTVLPKKWCWVRLGDILVFGPRNGTSPRPVDHETTVQSLTLGATTTGRFNESCVKFVDIAVDATSHLWLHPGEILVQRGNTIEYVGVAALYEGEPMRFIYPDLMMKIRVANEIDPKFIHLAMSAGESRSFLRERASGTSGSMPKINQATLSALPLCIPPLAEQKRIVAKVDQLMAMLDDLEQRQEKKRTAAIHVSKASLDSLVNAEDPDQLARAWERVSKNFGVVAGAEGGADELRHMILVLAMRGKLTRGIPGDQPIEETVASSSVPLPVNGRQRTAGRDPTVRQIGGDAALCVGEPKAAAPDGWRWYAMEEVACLESGHTPSRRHPEYWDGEISWIGIKDARAHHGEVIQSTEQTITDAGIANSAARLLPAGTVCLSRTASVGYVTTMGRSMATSQDFVNWVCSEALHPPFLVKILLAESRALRRFSKGTVHRTIYFPEVKAFHVCLPPVAEQRRIVKKVDQILSRLDALTVRSVNLRRSVCGLALARASTI